MTKIHARLYLLVTIVASTLTLSSSVAFAANVQQLQKQLKNPDMQMRIKAAKNLGKLGQTASLAIPDLMKALAQEGPVMYAAYLALNQIIVNPLQAFALLKQGISSNHRIVQSVCAQHLGRLLFEKATLQPTNPKLYTKARQVWGKASNVPHWVWTSGISDLAFYYMQRNKQTLALHVLKFAMGRGFDDYYVFTKMKIWHKLHANPAFQKLYRSMKMSAADNHEYWWLQKERQRVQHETTMLITQNMNRKDSMQTPIYMVKIPTRPTKSYAVLTGRWWLVWQQRMERVMVHKSDTQRRMHLMNMNLIRNMGSKKYRQKYVNRMIVLRSKRLALANAKRRLQQLPQRQFKIQKGLSTTPQPVPPFSSLKK